MKKKVITLWNITSKKELLTLQRNSLPMYTGSNVAIDVNGTLIALVEGQNNTIKIWKVNNKQEVLSLQVSSAPILSIALSPDGKLFALGSGKHSSMNFLQKEESAQEGYGEIQLWNINDRQKLITIRGHSAPVTSLAFSPDNTLLASGSGKGSEYGEIKLWNITTGKELLTLRGHANPVTSIAFNADGTVLASSGEYNETIKLWNVRDGQELMSLPGGSIKSMVFSPDGVVLASIEDYGKTIVFRNFDLDRLLVRGCKWLQDYLKTNPELSDEDRAMCEDILQAQQ